MLDGSQRSNPGFAVGFYCQNQALCSLSGQTHIQSWIERFSVWQWLTGRDLSGPSITIRTSLEKAVLLTLALLQTSPLPLLPGICSFW